jgi:hypothetical protein
VELGAWAGFGGRTPIGNHIVFELSEEISVQAARIVNTKKCKIVTAELLPTAVNEIVSRNEFYTYDAWDSAPPITQQGIGDML